MHDINTCNENHGVIIEPPKSTDYLQGAIPHVDEGVGGKWQPYQRNFEVQYAPNLEWVDYFNCVTQSITNQMVIYITKKIISGQIPVGHLNWLNQKGFIGKDGNLNFSEKFSAILNNTDPLRGNSYGQALDHLRVDGVIPESMLPSHINQTIAQYYNRADITPAMVELGKEFLKYFDPRHEWVGADPEHPTVAELQHALLQAPLICIIPGHSLDNVEQKTTSWIWFNSYIPFNDERVGSPLWAKKIVVNFIGDPPVNNEIMTEKEVRQLQALEGYKDDVGVMYWTGKTLSEYLAARLPDKIKTINESL